MHSHPHVPHPREAVAASRNWNDKLLGFLSGHVLASRVMFDIALVLPLLALPMSTGVKVTLGVISGSWIQWWALPSLQRSANIADAKREAKADADHEALTHIATVSDRLADLLDLATPGGLAAVHSEARSARSAAEGALAGISTLTSVMTAQPGTGPAPSPPPLPAETVPAVKPDRM